jgi:hypothetical protein
MSDQDRHYDDELRIPFLFVPHGDPFPTEWVREHPDYVRIPAIMLPRGTGCMSYEQACAWLQAREQEKVQREAQAEIDRAPVSGFGRSYAMGAPPMVRRPGRMMRGGPPPKYPGGWGAPEGEMSVGPDPVGTYLRMNAAMMAFAASYARGAGSGRPPPSLSPVDPFQLTVPGRLNAGEEYGNARPDNSLGAPSTTSSATVPGQAHTASQAVTKTPDQQHAVSGGPNEEPTSQIVLAQSQTCAEFIAENCKASILRVFPGQFLDVPVDEVLEAARNGDSAARRATKLLGENRFRK